MHTATTGCCGQRYAVPLTLTNSGWVAVFICLACNALKGRRPADQRRELRRFPSVGYDHVGERTLRLEHPLEERVFRFKIRQHFLRRLDECRRVIGGRVEE